MKKSFKSLVKEFLPIIAVGAIVAFAWLVKRIDFISILEFAKRYWICALVSYTVGYYYCKYAKGTKGRETRKYEDDEDDDEDDEDDDDEDDNVICGKIV